MKFIIIFIFFLFLQSNSQFQYISHLSGNGEVYSDAIFGTTGEFCEENSIGGNANSESILIPRSTDILVFFGQLPNGNSNRVWKYSLKKRQWMFLKGSKNANPFPININKLNVFNQEMLPGGRYSSKAWMNKQNEIITIFGGNAKTITQQLYSNEVWQYNHSSNSFLVNRCNNCGAFSTPNTESYSVELQYDESNIPGGRVYHEIIPIKETKEALIVGGINYGGGSLNLGDFWIFSTELMQFKYMGGGSNQKEHFEENNKYHPNNLIGSINKHSGVLINEEEVLIFGGMKQTSTSQYSNSNDLQKYNITSNQWKKIYNPLWDDEEYGRDYNDFNQPQARNGHKIWKISNNEILLFGGGSFSDEWRFNLETSKWRFTGKEITKFGRQNYAHFNSDGSYSDDTLMGGMSSFIGHFFEDLNELVVCIGEGKALFKSGRLVDCWSVYFGKMCNLLEDRDPNVCNQRGKCISHGICECTENSKYFGNNCEFTKCSGILSNESTVCSGKGICHESKCLCYVSSEYNKEDCTIDEEQKAIDEQKKAEEEANAARIEIVMNYLWVIISVPIFIVILVSFIIITTILFCVICLKQKNKIKKMDGIDDVDLILNEARLEQNQNKPKIKVDKSLFEIEYKELKLLSILGEGSQSVCYLVEWKNTKCAYKSFKTHGQDFETTSTPDDFYAEFEKEVKMYTNIRHPSILQFYGACLNVPSNVGLVLQYCINGDISKYFGKVKLSVPKKLNLLIEIAKGMHHLHSLNIMHRDLKPENILIDENGAPKIMDFGLSRFNSGEKTMTKQIGTSFYMAPEVFNNGKYSKKCDVFSFAILIFVIITENFFPYGIERTQDLILRKVAKSSKFRPRIKENDFGNCKFLINLIQRNWNENPEQRNSFEEIIDILSKEQKRKKMEQKKVIPKRPQSIKKSFESNKSKAELEKEIKLLKVKVRSLKKEIILLKRK